MLAFKAHSLNWLQNKDDFVEYLQSKHYSHRALAAILRFYEMKGVDLDFLNRLRRAIPRDNISVDLNVPAESAIVQSLEKLSTAPLKYRALYNLLLDSGLRVTEAIKALNQKRDGVIDRARV
jgi:intergrase/recombinase